MRYLFLSLFILAMLFQTFSKTVIFASFVANRDFIAKNLCENRSRPSMHCNGKCHLRKQLQKDESKQGNSELPSSLKSMDETLTVSEEIHSFQPAFRLVAPVAFPETVFHFPSSPVADIFHPPARLT